MVPAASITGERPLSPVSLAGLVRSRTVAALGTLHAGAPFVSMVPFAVLPEGDAFVAKPLGTVYQERLTK